MNNLYKGILDIGIETAVPLLLTQTHSSSFKIYPYCRSRIQQLIMSLIPNVLSIWLEYKVGQEPEIELPLDISYRRITFSKITYLRFDDSIGYVEFKADKVEYFP